MARRYEFYFRVPREHKIPVFNCGVMFFLSYRQKTTEVNRKPKPLIRELLQLGGCNFFNVSHLVYCARNVLNCFKS